MYIAHTRIQNYRCFRDTAVEFRPGLNVIIGENNAGKTTLLRAIMLVFERKGRARPDVHDFYRLLEPIDAPPTITAEVTIRSSPTDSPSDRALVASWLTRLDPPWEAKLTYSFFLPEQHAAEFKEALRAGEREQFFEILEEFLPKYVSRIYAGNPDTKVTADGDSLAKFDCQFLDALRDVETEMFAGNTPLFRTMLEGVLDLDMDGPKKRVLRDAFRTDANSLRQKLLGRLDTKRLFELAKETGASDGGNPTLQGAVDEADFIAALRLFVAHETFAFPATHNGLGYNNLIYISLVLASLSFRSSIDKLGENAAIFPMLLIEEPEAHLHPALQYKLLAHIVSRVRDEPHRNRQVFVTTHSTHVTAAAGLDPIMCMCIEQGGIHVAYPSKLFGNSVSDKKSRSYVERYLDATKSTMLFAKTTVFVEGIAEQLVIPAIATAIGRSFDANHVAVVRVDGLTFKHFLPLFGAGVGADRLPFALKRKVACVIDADPCRKVANTKGAKWRSCFPFQLGRDTATYEYRDESGALQNVRTLVNGVSNIGLYPAKKTFEYDIALQNLGNSVIVTDAMAQNANLRALSATPSVLPAELADLLEDEVKGDLAAVVKDDERNNFRFATLYLKCAEDSKGEHAFALEGALAQLDQTTIAAAFDPPKYIRDAIEWVTPAPKSVPPATPKPTAAEAAE
jgi:putative ATP-dependent endonuclease of OLD family